MVQDKNNFINAYSKNIENIRNLILAKDSFTYCGLPQTGKTRIIKMIIQELKLENEAELINLSRFETEDSNNELLNTFITELKDLYNKGKRIFIFQYMPFDNEITQELYFSLANFRKSCFVMPSYIFFSNTNPEFYPELVKVCPLLINNIVYETINSQESFEFILRQNEDRFKTSIPQTEIKNLLHNSGGIAGFVKKAITFCADNKNFEIKNFVQSMQSAVHQFLDELPDKELLLFRKVLKNGELNQLERRHLTNLGLTNINNKYELPPIIETHLKTYAREYDLITLKNQFYINGTNISKLLKNREKEILKIMFEEEIITRDQIAKLISTDSSTNISESSIDQVITRLRKTLTELGLKRDLIITIKKKGFKLQQN
jgi:predicted transcriptional regulator